jgi:uncharacterized C2H2 Zn-finger protein
METSATCSLCGPIPDKTTEYYDGSGDKFPPQVSLLKPHKLHHEDDFLECPNCGALFFSHEDRAFTGSGDSDGLVRTRLSEEDAAVLREVLHRAGRATDDPAGLAGGMLRLPDGLRDLAAIHLRKRDRALARRLLPDLVEYIARGSQWPAKFLAAFTTTPEDAALLLSELHRHAATPPLDRLRAHARATACSFCRSIAAYPPTKIRLDALPPALGALKRHGVSERTDVWECPECDSLFYWQSEDGLDGDLCRVDVLADLIRACLRHREAVDGKAIDALFRCGGNWERLAFALGMRGCADVVGPLVPRMVARLALRPERWLHDALCGFARDPAGAANILASIAKLQYTNPQVESLAARARAN